MALALSMDVFAVSISRGAALLPGMRLRSTVWAATVFGAFHLFMPVLGWSLGRLAADVVRAFDHWIAFALLLGVGGKMTWDALQEKKGRKSAPLLFSFYVLLTVAFATSLDAAAVGISLSFLKVDVLPPAFLMGGAAFLASVVGTFLGKRAGALFGENMKILGGGMLMAVGVKIILEHLFFSEGFF